MGILVRRGLEETDSRKIPRFQGVEKVVGIILMVAGITLKSDAGDAGWPRVIGVPCAGVVLERLVVLHVIAFGQSRGRRNRTSAAARAPIRIGNCQIETALEPAPAKPGAIEQITDIFPGQLCVERGALRAGVVERF